MKKPILTIAVLIAIAIASTVLVGCVDVLEGTSWEMVEIVETDSGIIVCADGEEVPDSVVKTSASCKIENDGTIVISCEFLGFEIQGKIVYVETKESGFRYYNVTYDDGTTGKIVYSPECAKTTNVSTNDGVGFSYSCGYDMSVSAGKYTFYFKMV